MKKKTLIFYCSIVFLFFAVTSTAQRKGDSWAKISNSYMIERFDSDTIKSILFIYEGTAEFFASRYFDLSRKLKKKWKKKKMLGFQYKVKIKNKELARQRGLKIPPDENSQIDPDLVVKIKSYDFKKKKIYQGVFEYTFKMNIELLNPETSNLMEFAQLEIKSNFDAIDTNRAIVKLIDKIIKEK